MTPAGHVTTLFGNSNAALADPTGIFYDAHSGTFLLTDDEQSALYQLSANGSAISQINTGSLLWTQPLF